MFTYLLSSEEFISGNLSLFAHIAQSQGLAEEIGTSGVEPVSLAGQVE